MYKNEKGFSLVEGLLVVVAILVLGFGAYYVWNENNAEDITTSTEEVSVDTKSDENNLTTETEENCTAPTSSDIESIEASITSKNTAGLGGYMANSVNVVLASSSGLGNQTAEQAIGQITSFVTDTSNWDFDLPSSTLGKYSSSSYKEYFPEDAVVGKDSTTTKVISFNFDCEGEIDTVFEALQEKLIK
ncbi:MAG: hypothetical protein U5L95_04815 [Candidatus Saccharibacteria bacterium]|nr:hypothetical protein [Candidatus Saccharibacteria bacterium]